MGEVTRTEKPSFVTSTITSTIWSSIDARLMDKHLKAFTPRYLDTKFIKVDAENAPFFVAKLAIKTFLCVIFFRLVGFLDLSGKDDFSMNTLVVLLIKKAIVTGSLDCSILATDVEIGTAIACL
ncbi:thioredoxin domain-containing protein PLP3B-like [Impatiens glandulifera]|uniref:thioredoxin domain-containing protein PLP3B-like n=1 Tax=Impatiens glandulifera TaxID=253017 RepID=UPI001FB05B2E|nr:thioredoxin domain-containing protein PLP3B-like [Impatiens glandulifera]